MTRKQFELRIKANVENYIHKDTKACVDAIMELYKRIPDAGGDFRPLYRYRSLNSDEMHRLTPKESGTFPLHAVSGSK